MGFASPFPDVDIADVSVFGLALYRHRPNGSGLGRAHRCRRRHADDLPGAGRGCRRCAVTRPGTPAGMPHLGPVASRGRRAAQVQRARSIGRDRRAGLIEDFS